MDGGVGGGSYSVTDGGVEPDDTKHKMYGRLVIYFMVLVTLAIVAWQKLYDWYINCLLYTSPSPRDGLLSRMPSSA